jgi:hypothetical protein
VQVVVSSGDLVAFGQRRWHNEVHGDEAGLGVWSAFQSFPEEEEGIGWSGAGGSDLRALVGRIDFLRDWTNQEIREVRRGREGGGRLERGGDVHR